MQDLGKTYTLEAFQWPVPLRTYLRILNTTTSMLFRRVMELSIKNPQSIMVVVFRIRNKGNRLLWMNCIQCYIKYLVNQGVHPRGNISPNIAQLLHCQSTLILNYYYVLLCLTPDDFTHQGKSAIVQLIKGKYKLIKKWNPSTFLINARSLLMT